MNFKVIPIPTEIAKTAREKMVSPQYKSLMAISAVANGYGPCRSCLKTFRQGQEDRIYITYNSSDGLSDLPSPGPIFLHKENCEQFESDGFPFELRDLPMLFEGFGNDSELILREKVQSEILESQIDSIFRSSTIKYINIRNAEAGCFIARIDRIA